MIFLRRLIGRAIHPKTQKTIDTMVECLRWSLTKNLSEEQHLQVMHDFVWKLEQSRKQ